MRAGKLRAKKAKKAKARTSFLKLEPFDWGKGSENTSGRIDETLSKDTKPAS